MWTEIANLAISNGIFAALFVALLLYTLKDTANREKKYTETIKKLSNQLDVVTDIKKSVDKFAEKLEIQTKAKNSTENKKAKPKTQVA